MWWSSCFILQFIHPSPQIFRIPDGMGFWEEWYIPRYDPSCPTRLERLCALSTQPFLISLFLVRSKHLMRGVMTYGSRLDKVIILDGKIHSKENSIFHTVDQKWVENHLQLNWFWKIKYYFWDKTILKHTRMACLTGSLLSQFLWELKN